MIIYSRGVEITEAKCFHVKYGSVSKAFGKVMIYFALIKRLYIPHQKFLTPHLIERAQAYTDYVDDGLDTIRLTPRNFKLGIHHTSRYFTFSDYRNLPIWFPQERVVPVCSLRELLMERGEFQRQTPSEDFVVIESGNLPMATIVEITKTRSVCYLEHRNPTKRIPNAPDHWRRDRFGSMTESILVSGYRGTVICGDSMSAIILNYAEPPIRFKLIYVGKEISILPKFNFVPNDPKE